MNDPVNAVLYLEILVAGVSVLSIEAEIRPRYTSFYTASLLVKEENEAARRYLHHVRTFSRTC